MTLKENALGLADTAVTKLPHPKPAKEILGLQFWAQFSF